jgi:N-glycosylase/DNA lyase
MKMQLSPSCPFNLDLTLCCGQVFRWSKQNEWWYGVVEGKVLKIRQIGDGLEFENCDVEFIKNYFGLNDNLPQMLSKITKDEHVKHAVEIFNGLRIIHQNPWECLISYICATYKNISAIKQVLFNLSRKFGEEIHFEGQKFYTFPTAERLAKATTQELANCGLGYRINYVSETAKRVYENHFDLEGLRNVGYEEARKELLGFPGVGLKVADCVLLFSLEKFEAFPVDVWIKRVILKYYADHFPKEFVRKISGKRGLSNTEYEKLNFFGRKYFGEVAGYAQEYLYHYGRTHG